MTLSDGTLSRYWYARIDEIWDGKRKKTVYRVDCRNRKGCFIKTYSTMFNAKRAIHYHLDIYPNQYKYKIGTHKDGDRQINLRII